MFRAVLCRKKFLHDSGENGIARITMRRAVRNEGTYLAIQLLMLLTSFWAVFKVKPITPSGAIQFYFATLGVRAIIAVLLVWSSLKDRQDRQALRSEIDKLTPEDCPPSKLG